MLKLLGPNTVETGVAFNIRLEGSLMQSYCTSRGVLCRLRLGPRVGPYSLFWGLGSLITPFKPKRVGGVWVESRATLTSMSRLLTLNFRLLKLP